MQHVEWTSGKVAKARCPLKLRGNSDSGKYGINSLIKDIKVLNYRTFMLMSKGNIIGEDFLYSSRMDKANLPSKEQIHAEIKLRGFRSISGKYPCFPKYRVVAST